MRLLALLRRVWYALTHREAPGFSCVRCGRCGPYIEAWQAIVKHRLIGPVCVRCFDKINEDTRL